MDTSPIEDLTSSRLSFVRLAEATSRITSKCIWTSSAISSPSSGYVHTKDKRKFNFLLNRNVEQHLFAFPEDKKPKQSLHSNSVIRQISEISAHEMLQIPRLIARHRMLSESPKQNFLQQPYGCRCTRERGKKQCVGIRESSVLYV